MKVVNIISVLLLLIGSRGNCQYYVNLGDNTGYDVGFYQAYLNQNAKLIADSIPPLDTSIFKVYSFGFYYHAEPFPQAISYISNQHKTTIQNTTPYYLLIGRLSNSFGLFNQYTVDFNLPNDSIFSCINQEDLNNLQAELLANLNDPNMDYSFYAEKESRVMDLLNEFLIRKIKCCDGRSRVNEDVDTSLLKILLCIDNCGQQYSPEHSIGLIANNSMPEIGFKIYYPDNNICAELDARMKIFYKRGCNSYTRNDSIVFTGYNYKLNDFVFVDFGTRSVFGKEFPVIEGGLAEILITNIFGDTLKIFRFSIKGVNPKIGEVMKYLDTVQFSINNTLYNNIWFLKRLTLHESASGKNSSASDTMLQFNYYYRNKERLNLAYDNDNFWEESSRCPNFSANRDCGMGMTQLTALDDPLPYRPPAQALWDWKCNIYGAFRLLMIKKNYVKSYAESDIDVVNTWNNENPNDLVEKFSIEYAGVTWVMSNSIAFDFSSNKIDNYYDVVADEDEYSFLDACAMIAYNGYQGTNFKIASPWTPYKNFVFAQTVSPNDKPTWVVDDNINNYVLEIMHTNTPIY